MSQQSPPPRIVVPVGQVVVENSAVTLASLPAGVIVAPNFLPTLGAPVVASEPDMSRTWEPDQT